MGLAFYSLWDKTTDAGDKHAVNPNSLVRVRDFLEGTWECVSGDTKLEDEFRFTDGFSGYCFSMAVNAKGKITSVAPRIELSKENGFPVIRIMEVTGMKQLCFIRLLKERTLIIEKSDRLLHYVRRD